jgi:hypothetical protein
MSRVCAVLTVLAALVSSGVVQGLWTNRWASTAALERATARMAGLPMTLGDWDGRPGEVDPRQLDVADVSGCLCRHYVNRRTGAVVTVLLLCGRPGPIAVHTPEVCYPGAGFAQVGGRVKRAAPGQAGEFWAYRFQKDAAVPERLSVLATWNAAGRWEAAEHPRAAFAAYPALYKLYLIRPVPPEDEPAEDGPSAEFLRALLPALGECLAPPP